MQAERQVVKDIVMDTTIHRLLSPLHRRTISLHRELIGIADVGRRRDIDLSLNSYRRDIKNLARELMHVLAQSILDKDYADPVYARRRRDGFIFDAFGNPVPPAGRTSKVTDPNASLKEIVRSNALLFTINGDEFLPRNDFSVNAAQLQRGVPWKMLTGEPLSPWERRLEQRLVSIIDYGRLLNTDRLNNYLRRTLGSRLKKRRGVLGSLRSAGGILAAFEMLFRQEAMRMAEVLKDQLPRSGFTLRVSRSTSSHVLRNGWTWYKDGRVGSHGPWVSRIVPPYRPNCLCYSHSIYDEPTHGEDVEFFAFPMKKVRGAPILHLRDTAAYSKWFNAQIPETQITLMGEKRWMAVASLGGVPLYVDFLNLDGTIRSVRSIVGGDVSTQQRLEIMRRIDDRRRTDKRLPPARDFQLRQRVERAVSSLE